MAPQGPAVSSGHSLALRLTTLFAVACDMASGYALCTILSQPSPRVALAIGYWLTTGGIAWSAAALVPGFINMYKNDIERNKSHCTVLLGSLLLMGVSLAGFSVLVVTPLQLSGVVGGFLRG